MSAVLAVVARHPGEFDDGGAAEAARLQERVGPFGPVSARVAVALPGLVAEAVDDVRRHTAPPLAVRPDAPVVAVDAHLAGRADLRSELRRVGHAVRDTASDRELVEEGWAAWGTGVFDRLLGEWAVVVWDPASRRLVAAGDQIGNRRIFWASTPSGLVLGTRLALVVDHPWVDDELDERAVGAFLLAGVPGIEPEDTCFAAVRRLPKGWSLVADEQGVRTRRYWSLPVDTPMLRLPRPRDYVEQFRDVLTRAVVDRLEDVPRAVVHLSGGLDSTAVAALAVEAREQGRHGTDLSAVTVGFNVLTPDTEFYFADLVARREGLPHHLLVADDKRLERPLSLRVEPLQDFAVGLTRELATRTRERAPLAIGGKGGDEVLTATAFRTVLMQHRPGEAVELYRWLTQMLGHRPPLGSRARLLRALARKYGFMSTPRADPPDFPYPRWLQPDFARRADLPGLWQELWSVPPAAVLHRTQPDVARFVEAASWETRQEFTPEVPGTAPDLTLPFGDLRVITFCLSLPPVPFNRRKALLREALRGRLPEQVLDRTKTPAPPFPVDVLQRPEARWIDHWTSTSVTDRFVVRAAVPPVWGTTSLGAAVVDTRPVFLDEWLRGRGRT